MGPASRYDRPVWLDSVGLAGQRWGQTLTDADINAQGGYYGSALQVALAHGHMAVVRLLLEKDTDVNAQGGPYGSMLSRIIMASISKCTQLIALDS